MWRGVWDRQPAVFKIFDLNKSLHSVDLLMNELEIYVHLEGLQVCSFLGMIISKGLLLCLGHSADAFWGMNFHVVGM